jgi:hypothetical protein
MIVAIILKVLFTMFLEARALIKLSIDQQNYCSVSKFID